MRARGATAVAGIAVALAACTGAGDDTAAPPSTAHTVSEGPVAATAVVPGDCLTDVVIGAAERAEVESARKVSCHSEHTLEVFATFELDPAALGDSEGTDYPGTPRVVRAADQGCSERFEELSADPEAYGIIALWPSRPSWAVGDRTVACALFSASGELFRSPQVA